MNGYCYSCAMRFVGGCDAYDKTYESKITSPFHCPEYRQVTVNDVCKDGKKYRIINDFTHLFVEELDGKEAREKYGECEWRGGYSEYSAIDIWIDIKENKQ